MSQQTLAALSAALLWLALIAYAILGGADFGGGIWDLLARGPAAARERAAIARGMGPVWESNNVWLVFVLVVTWTAFPVVAAGVSSALFIPITLAVIGIVLRGAAFSFRSNYGVEVGAGVRWGHVFSGASIITPLLLGTVAGALASGNIRVANPPLRVTANPWTTWTTPFALACGLFAVGLCSVLAATYLTVETRGAGEEDLTQRFQRQAMVAGAVTALLGAAAALLAIAGAPVLWQGLVGRALPISIAAVLLGLATAAALLRQMYSAARALVAAETIAIFAAWGVAQWPFLIVPDVTIQNAASPASVLGPLLIVSVLGLAILLPSLWYLFSVVKRQAKAPRTAGKADGAALSTAAFVATLRPADEPQPPARAANVNGPLLPLPAAVPGAALLERAEPVLLFSLVVAMAPVVTRMFDTTQRVTRRQMRQMIARRRERRRAARTRVPGGRAAAQ
jgi:cytochrome d ubiquinol oxidase subunit II